MMAPQPDVQKPHDDPYSLVGENWPTESESAYHTAETDADTISTTAKAQAESADDATGKTDSGMQGKTADSVSGAYASLADQLHLQSQSYTTISGWMLDAASKVRKAKKQISDLVSAGTSDIRDAVTSETAGTPVTPSSTELTSKYRDDIAGVASKLTTDLDGIGHSVQGAPGASTTPSYVSVSTEPTTERPDPHAVVTAYNHGDQPAFEPQKLPPMPRATSIPSMESSSAPSSPSAPTAPTHSVNPTLSNLIAGSGPSGTPSSPSTSSSRGSASSSTPAPAGQAHQPSEQHQQIRPTGLLRVPNIPLPDLPAAAATITTAVSAASGTQLPTASTAPTSPGSSQVPASTGITPGASGTPPVTPTPPAGLAPIGGGGLSTPPVTLAPPAPQGTPGTPVPPGVQAPAPQAPTPAPAPRGPVADLGWIQRTYGLSPSLELSKPENTAVPALFIAGLAEDEAHLHRLLATIRQAFESAGWSQPLAVASIRRGLETKLVYVTADALSIHPSGVSLPDEVLPMDEMSGVPATSDLSGSLMVTDKLTALIPHGWEIEGVLSTVPGGESSQSAEEFQLLVEAGELLPCTVFRGRSDVTDDEALRVFARAAIGSGGCSDLDTESARIRAARWIGTQPAGYLDGLSRWYLADAAEQMGQGNWGEAVWACEKYMSTRAPRSKAA